MDILNKFTKARPFIYLNVCVNYGTSQTGNLCNYEYLKMLRFKILKSPPVRGVSFVVAKKIWRKKCGYIRVHEYESILDEKHNCQQ